MRLCIRQLGLKEICLYADPPIEVEIRHGGGHVFAENVPLRIYAHGHTLAEALEVFEAVAVDQYEYHQNLRGDQMTSECVTLKALYMATFKPQLKEPEEHPN